VPIRDSLPNATGLLCFVVGTFGGEGGSGEVLVVSRVLQVETTVFAGAVHLVNPATDV